jgi:SAM-dependent methyltransferase
VTVIALSRHLSFHARGDAAFVWHGLTGDVAEMSRDVLALLLAFDPPQDEKAVTAGRDELEEFVSILRSRRFLVHAGSGGHAVDEIAPLLVGIPRIPRAAVYERSEQGVIIYTRAGEAFRLDPITASLFLKCDGERSLGQVLGDAGPQALPALLRLARADMAALKLLAKPASQGGVHLNPAAESTMPYPEIPDPRAYTQGGEPPQAKAEDEPTFASLFAAKHASLNGRTYSEALADELQRRGAFTHVRGRKPRALELATGPGLGQALRDALERHGVELQSVNVFEGVPPESADAIVANEIALQLGFSEGKNSGALKLVTDAAAALAPGGVLIVSDFGDPKKDAEPGSVKFADLQAEATERGLGARVLPLIEVLGLDASPQALSTTRASWPALKALFAAHGLDLERRAWLRSEIEKLVEGKLDLATVHGLQWAPLSERALGLSPKNFWALVATKPERVLH